jgi:hypothetical protein
MTKKAKENVADRFARKMTETANGMLVLGIIDADTYKLTMPTPPGGYGAQGRVKRQCLQATSTISRRRESP